jgi:hypothetical protein
VKDWRLAKNYRLHEKQAISAAIKTRHLSRRNLNIKVRGKPVKWERIARHDRMNGDDPQVAEKRLDAPDVDISLRDEDSVSDIVVNIPYSSVSALDFLELLLPTPTLSRPMPMPDDLRHAESIFAQAQSYVESRLLSTKEASSIMIERSAAGINHIFEGKAVLNQVVDLYVRALHALAVEPKRYAEARMFLDRAFAQLEIALKQQHSALLSLLLGIMAMPTIFEDFDPCTLFSKFAPQLSKTILGIRHPVTVAVQLFQKSPMKSEIMRSYTRNLESCSNRILGIYHPESLSARLSFDMLVRMHLGGQMDALKEGHRLAMQKYGKHHSITLNVLHDLGGFQMRAIHNHGMAEWSFRELHRRAVHVGNKAFQLTAVVGLAIAADRCESYERSLALFQQGVCLSDEVVGRDHWYTQALLRWRDDVEKLVPVGVLPQYM